MIAMQQRVLGAEELRYVLKELGPKLDKKLSAKALRKGASPILKAARKNARKLGTRGERQLAKSMGIRIKRYTARGITYAAVGPRWPQGAHGHLVEFGHRTAKRGTGTLARVVKPGARARTNTISKVTGEAGGGVVGGFVPAHPFLRPAYDANKAQAQALMAQEFAAGVEREAQQLSYSARAGRIGARWVDILKREAARA